MAGKIGDIFKITDKRAPSSYLQVVGKDYVAMNSDVIAVFRGSYHPNIQNSEQSELLFYTHTMVLQGLRDKLWEKVSQ